MHSNRLWILAIAISAMNATFKTSVKNRPRVTICPQSTLYPRSDTNRAKQKTIKHDNFHYSDDMRTEKKSKNQCSAVYRQFKNRLAELRWAAQHQLKILQIGRKQKPASHQYMKTRLETDSFSWISWEMFVPFKLRWLNLMRAPSSIIYQKQMAMPDAFNVQAPEQLPKTTDSKIHYPSPGLQGSTVPSATSLCCDFWKQNHALERKINIRIRN